MIFREFFKILNLKLHFLKRLFSPQENSMVNLTILINSTTMSHIIVESIIMGCPKQTRLFNRAVNIQMLGKIRQKSIFSDIGSELRIIQEKWRVNTE